MLARQSSGRSLQSMDKDEELSSSTSSSRCSVSDDCRPDHSRIGSGHRNEKTQPRIFEQRGDQVSKFETDPTHARYSRHS